MIISGRNIQQRFWAKVQKTDSCWLWTAGRDTMGYGQIEIDGRSQQAHRVAWMLHNGDIPTGLRVLHHCDVRNCVNPEHLFLGTQRDNVDDALKKGKVLGFLGLRRPKITNECGHPERRHFVHKMCHVCYNQSRRKS